MAAAEESKKPEEVVPESPAEPPPPAAAPAAVVEEEKEKAIVPADRPVIEDKPADDSKALAIVEKPAEPVEDKPSEGSVNRDAVLARVATEKKDALIKAWEESDMGLGVTNHHFDGNLEIKKAKYIEKMKNKIALLHKTAEEKRAATEAKRGEDLLKEEEVAAKCRATGTTPKKGWFSS